MSTDKPDAAELDVMIAIGDPDSRTAFRGGPKIDDKAATTAKIIMGFDFEGILMCHAELAIARIIREDYATQEAELAALRKLLLSTISQAEDMAAMPCGDWAAKVRKAAQALGGE